MLCRLFSAIVDNKEELEITQMHLRDDDYIYFERSWRQCRCCPGGLKATFHSNIDSVRESAGESSGTR